MPGRHQPQRAENVEAGDIYRLPEKSKLDEAMQHAATLEEGCFGHPIVVLSVEDDKLFADVLILSTLKGKSLDEYTQKFNNATALQIRRKHVPINHDEPANPDTNVLELHLDGGLKLLKKTYVKTADCHRIPCTLMNAFRDRKTGRKYRLRADSLKALNLFVKSEPPKSPSFEPNIRRGGQQLPPRPALAPVHESIVSPYGVVKATQFSAQHHLPKQTALPVTGPVRSALTLPKPQSSRREAFLRTLPSYPPPSNWSPRLAENRPLLPRHNPKRYNAAPTGSASYRIADHQSGSKSPDHVRRIQPSYPIYDLTEEKE